MEKLFEIQKIIIDQLKRESFYDRAFFNTITLDNKITGIVGNKGIGKTTLLLKSAIKAGAEKHQALYVSADHLYFLENKIIDLVDQLYKTTDVHLLCIDEIHKYPNWKQELKNIADIYRDFRILFSGSSAIDLIQGKYDLSRRVTLHHLHGFSFREYLEFSFNLKLPTIDFETLTKKHIAFAQALSIPQPLKHFKEYLKIGYYPFFKELSKERDKFQAIDNTTLKTIYEDIASLRSLKTPTLLIIEKLYKYVINSLPGEISSYKLANTLGKDFESIREYLYLLEQSGLIRLLYPKKSGKAYLRMPAKMYPENTNLIYASYLPVTQDSVIGKIRETFVINQLQNAGLSAYYSEAGDFNVDGFVLEIGGKSKTKKQIKEKPNAFVVADDILLGDKRTIPLFLLGFLY
ncbi:MAG: ATPase [Gammaproteobacteria bacterium]|jgi:predicted AAA+ superfamily ATPase|nr:ATPase [Gammaproteobacteria bacterium]